MEILELESTTEIKLKKTADEKKDSLNLKIG